MNRVYEKLLFSETIPYFWNVKILSPFFYFFYYFSHFGRYFDIISVEKLYEYAFFFKERIFVQRKFFSCLK